MLGGLWKIKNKIPNNNIKVEIEKTDSHEKILANIQCYKFAKDITNIYEKFFELFDKLPKSGQSQLSNDESKTVSNKEAYKLHDTLNCNYYKNKLQELYLYIFTPSELGEHGKELGKNIRELMGRLFLQIFCNNT
jgi:hypothetical protein